MFETGTAVTDLSELMSLLGTFANAAGWTVEDVASTYQRTIHRGGCFASFRWTNAERYLGHYQSTGYTGATLPHNMPGDSGQGTAGTPGGAYDLNTDMLSAGPYPNYWFFASDEAPYYIYVVVEVSTGVYKHFGFGSPLKYGNWDGGEFHYSQMWDLSSSNAYSPDRTRHSFLLDRTSITQRAAPIRISGMSGQSGSGVWGICTSSTYSGNDRAGNPRVVIEGLSRGGLWLEDMNIIRSGEGLLHKPLVPILFNYRQATNQHTFLGEMADVGIVNMAGFSPQEEFLSGSDTYVVFPWIRKRYTGAATDEESWNAGVAYKKIVTP